MMERSYKDCLSKDHGHETPRLIFTECITWEEIKNMQDIYEWRMKNNKPAFLNPKPSLPSWGFR
jgi:hypothetical protein